MILTATYIRIMMRDRVLQVMMNRIITLKYQLVLQKKIMMLVARLEHRTLLSQQGDHYGIG